MPALFDPTDDFSCLEKIDQLQVDAATILADRSDAEERLQAEMLFPYQKFVPDLQNLLAEAGEPLSAHDRESLLTAFKAAGVQLDPSRYTRVEDFAFVISAIAESERLAALESHYNKDTHTVETFFDDEASSLEFSWMTGVSKEEEERIHGHLQKIEEAEKALNKAYAQAEAIELRPGVAVLDLLCYPRWAMERDAELGAFTDLRTLRQETSIDFFQELSVFSKSEREVLQLAEDEEFMSGQPLTNRDTYKHQAEFLRDLYRDKEGTTVLKEVHDYMQRIGATHRAMRKLKTAGITPPSKQV